MNEQVFVIVDPFSSGRFLAPEFIEKYNAKCIAIISSKTLPAIFVNSFNQDHFTHVYWYEGDYEALLEDVIEHKPTAVIPGSEPGVLLADRLAADLNLFVNTPKLSEARRNKYLMSEALREKGLNAAQQILTNSADEAIQWVSAYRLEHCVLKPKDSGGTDGVVFCNSMDEIRNYFDKYLSTTSFLGSVIDNVLVQEFLDGTEYVVDTVSLNGQHQVVAVWKYAKSEANGSKFVYDTMTLLQSLTASEDALVEYTKKCLDALGILNGPAHNEVMLTSKGPYMVETGARPHGGNGTLISGKCVGYNQIDRTCMLYANPKQFKETFKEMYSTERVAQEIFLINSKEGVFKGLRNEERIKSLPSFSAMTLSCHLNEKIEKTVNLFTSPGRVILIGPVEQMLEDYSVVRAWECEGGYDVG